MNNVTLKFLEYTEWKKGQHFISVIIEAPGIKGEDTPARIYREWNNETRKFMYTAKDNMDINIFEPTDKLHKLKNDLKDIKIDLAKMCPGYEIEKDVEEPKKIHKEEQLKDLRESKEKEQTRGKER